MKTWIPVTLAAVLVGYLALVCGCATSTQAEKAPVPKPKQWECQQRTKGSSSIYTCRSHTGACYVVIFYHGYSGAITQAIRADDCD